MSVIPISGITNQWEEAAESAEYMLQPPLFHLCCFRGTKSVNIQLQPQQDQQAHICSPQMRQRSF